MDSIDELTQGKWFKDHKFFTDMRAKRPSRQTLSVFLYQLSEVDAASRRWLQLPGHLYRLGLPEEADRLQAIGREMCTREDADMGEFFVGALLDAEAKRPQKDSFKPMERHDIRLTSTATLVEHFGINCPYLPATLYLCRELDLRRRAIASGPFSSALGGAVVMERFLAVGLLPALTELAVESGHFDLTMDTPGLEFLRQRGSRHGARELLDSVIVKPVVDAERAHVRAGARAMTEWIECWLNELSFFAR